MAWLDCSHTREDMPQAGGYCYPATRLDMFFAVCLDGNRGRYQHQEIVDAGEACGTIIYTLDISFKYRH